MLFFMFLGYKFVVWPLRFVKCVDLFQFLGCQVPKLSLHLTLQHSNCMLCFHY